MHIEDLHQPPVILAICMSIALNGIPRRPILSALASIAPDHREWNTLLDIVDWHIDDDAFLESYYSDSREVIPAGDTKRLKKNLKEVVDVLTDCVEIAKDRNSGIYWVGGPFASFRLPSIEYFTAIDDGLHSYWAVGNSPWISMAKVEEKATRFWEA
ncbi:hypothetical protein DFS33DRAFT_1124136 [Desarmillaria ectypa]|nr:hypothetical protein DFS33DRAFT_1124136 [Desarmillaria ectypa]